nr:zinc finger C2H2-type/integrase DNA-binding domain-containing protein [Tanacetum cinerariifolium]
INKPYLSSVNDEGLPTCFQCGKSFPFMKSLSVHMRCHPYCFLRGIIPPPSAVLAQGNPQALMNFANGHRPSVIEGSNSNANSSPSIDKGKEVVMQVEDHESKEVQMELDDHESRLLRLIKGRK